MYKRILLSLTVITGMTMNHCASSSTKATNITAATAACIDTLQQATQHASGFFIKVHAGEALALNNYPEGIEETFTRLKNEKPDYAIGATRVLARLYSNSPEKKKACIDFLIDRYLHEDSTHPRMVAIESLAKLGYSDAIPEMKEHAQTGEGGFKALARWVISNNGEQATEDSLAALLALPQPSDYRGAAYALRFKKDVSEKTYQQLVACMNRVTDTAVAAGRVYVVSSVFVHTPADKLSEVKLQLLHYLEGAANERYETAEALSLKGGADDLPTLNKMLQDPDNDVRVAAANAIIKIEARNKKI